ncbi:tetratricopeptide repeat protein [Polyangium mundeleinium]|uniref:Tetratricopeptide repeat protein n=1 Tax=Polyangium mundeleinium TaxID=2995306 RepID=A0ABT5F627_9BACT|nr:hypothetical protein [Polyangium mundeleinium]MDC0749552.1 hypothetical protein [Polyangium mundeleinium]
MLVELHREMRAGRSDGERADRLRDEMDAPYLAASEEEQALLDDLSEDLYIIEGKRRVEPLVEGETLENVQKQLASAFRADENRRTLELLRKLPTLEAHHIDAIGMCWERQGFYIAASCFYDFANEIEPNDTHEVLAFHALARAGLTDETSRRAAEIELRDHPSARLMLEAACILERAAVGAAEEAARKHTHELVVRLVERAWSDDAALPLSRAAGLVAAGIAYDRLGDKERALQSFERAVAAHHYHETLVARGLALLHVDRTRAMWDFTEAAKQGTRHEWPYLYAALFALESGRIADAERFCEAGLSITRQAQPRGLLLECWAIAAAGLRRPARQVNALFDQAMAELPLDMRIRRNARRYREALQAERVLPVNEYERAEDIDEAQAWESLRQLAA